MLNHFKTLALNSLMSKAETDRLEALASLETMLLHPAGIGDHSTTDLHNNLNESLAGLADAEDRIETLKRNFPLDFKSMDKNDIKPPF